MVNIAIDFGTTNTMIGVFDIENNSFKILTLQDISAKYNKYSTVPSKIAYKDNGKNMIGEAIDDSFDDENIFTRMKLYLNDDNVRSIKRKIGHLKIDHRQAGIDFISLLLDLIFIDYPPSQINKLVLTVPVNSFDTYRSILTSLCETKKVYNYLILDESTAVSLGYNAVISPDYPYIIIDFGGGTLDISIVRINNAVIPNKVDVFGKAGSTIGGEEIDNWLIDDFIAKNDLELNDIKSYKNELKNKVENLKIQLSKENTSSFKICNKVDDYDLYYSLNRIDFDNILKNNYLPNVFQETLDTAIGIAIENGIPKKEIKKAFLVGGSSQIPLFIDLVKQNFGEKVQCDEPFSAVINGACKFISGTIIEDFLHHDYCIKHFIRSKGIYDYEVIVPQKTKFPIKNVCQRVISSAFDGQEEIELEFFEILTNIYESEMISDILYDDFGNLVAIKDQKNIIENRKVIPLNDTKNHFIKLSPPGISKEPRVKLTFHVSDNRILTLDAIDLKDGKEYCKDKEIARLK